MEYISTLQAANKWNVSDRQVQRLASSGRIAGAKKCGASWLVPSDAEKPIDPRKQKKQPQRYFAYGILNSVTGILPDDEEEKNKYLENEELRFQYECELSYMRGDFESAKHCFTDIPETSSMKMCACSIAICAAISTGDYDLFTQIKAFLDKQKEIGSAETARLSEMTYALASISMFADNMVPEWLIKCDFEEFPEESRNHLTYMYIKYLQITKKYSEMLSCARIMLAMNVCPGKVSFTDIYMALFCASAALFMGDEQQCTKYLNLAFDMALPLGIITPLAETLMTFGGKMESLLMKRYPEYYNAVVNQHEKTIKCCGI